MVEIADKIREVQSLHEALTYHNGREPVLSDWTVKIMAEVAELPKHRETVHAIRAIVKARATTVTPARR